MAVSTLQYVSLCFYVSAVEVWDALRCVSATCRILPWQAVQPTHVGAQRLKERNAAQQFEKKFMN
jgi:hypothetical protein